MSTFVPITRRPTDQTARTATTGPCYSCRHVSRTVNHCYGTGDLPADGAKDWPGFICSCDCRHWTEVVLPEPPGEVR